MFHNKYVVINGHRHDITVSKKTPVSFYYRGKYYEAPEEVWIARLLRKFRMRFRHHVCFDVDIEIEGRMKLHHWHPDFLFIRPLRWLDDHQEGTIIHGIEVKKKKMNGKPQQLADAVETKYGVRILVINRSVIHQWHEARLFPGEEL